MLLLGLLNGFNTRIQDNPAVPPDVKTQIAAATEEGGIPIVTTEQAHQALLDAGLAPAEADAVTADYGNAQLDALKTSMLAVAFLAVLSLWLTRRLPGKQSRRTPPDRAWPRPSADGVGAYEDMPPTAILTAAAGARIVLGDPLPDDVEILPPPARDPRCSRRTTCATAGSRYCIGRAAPGPRI